MHCHQLIFTPAEAQLLREQYGILKRFLEAGNLLPPAGHTKLTETLHHVLLNQEGLRDFWQKTKDYPLNHHYLHLTATDKELLNLPWQLAIDEQKYPYFHITKGVPDPNTPELYFPAPGPLKILVMISSPEDLEGNHRLSYEAEEEAILRALGPLWEKGQVQVDFTADGSLQSLEAQLATQYYHILHFSGHGVYSYNTGYLVLENAITLKQENVKPEQLVRTLKSKPGHIPALVVLSSCQTGQGQAVQGFRGVADELIHYGLPAVMAMTFSVSDHFATVFAGGLYEALAKREPLPYAYGKALQGMRQAEKKYFLDQKQTHTPCQWLIPQLYCSYQVQHIVNWETPVQLMKVSSDGIIKGEHFPFLNLHEHYRFIGRRRECAQLFNRLLNNEPTLITGQGGVGKTTMAQHLVKRVITHNPQYHYFIFNETGISIPAMIAQVQQYLAKTHHLYSIKTKTDQLAKAQEQMDFLLEELMKTGCKPIWVFDNMETCQEGIAGPIKQEYVDWFEYIKSRLLTGNFPVIFTGRYPIQELSGIEPDNLNQVPYLDFYQKCLQLELKKMSDTSAAIEPVVVPDQSIDLAIPDIASLLHSTLGGSYRALEFFDEVYKQAPACTLGLLKQLQAAWQVSNQEQERATSKELTAAVQERLETYSKRLVFGELLALLDDEAIYTLQLLSHFHRPVLPKALEMQMSKDYNKALLRLRDITLIEEHVIIQDEEKLLYYYVTPLVRDWLEDKKLPAIEFSHNVAGEYYEYVDEHINRHNYKDLEEAFRHYTITRNTTKLNSIGATLSNYFYSRFLYQQSFSYAIQVEQIAQTETHPDLLINLGAFQNIKSNFSAALGYYEKALARFQTEANKDGEATAYNNIGQLLQTQGNYAKALSYLQKSLMIRKTLEDLKKESVIYNNMGLIYQALGQHDKALELFEQSLSISNANKEPKAIAWITANIGMIYLNQGAYDFALTCFQKSLQIQQTIGDQYGFAQTNSCLSDYFEAKGEYGQALVFLQKGLAIYHELGDQQGVGTTFNNMGLLQINQGYYQEALETLYKSLQIMQSIGDRPQEIITLNNLGVAYLHLGNYPKAYDHLALALTTSQSIGDIAGEGITLLNISHVYQVQGKLNKTLEYLEKSQKISVSIGDSRQQAITLNNISQVYYNWGNYAKALELLEQGLAICESIGAQKEVSGLFNSLGKLCLIQGLTDKALEYFHRSLVIFKDIGDRDGEGSALNNIAQVYQSWGNYEEAILYMEQSLDIIDNTGNLSGRFGLLNNIGLLYSEVEAYEEALTYLAESLAISQTIKDPEKESTSLNNMSLVYRHIQKYDTALTYSTKSLHICQVMDDLAGQATVLHNLAAIALKKGEHPDQFYHYALEAYTIFTEINHANGIYEVGQDLGRYLCEYQDPPDYAAGIVFLQKSYEIGLLAKFPGVEEIAALIQKHSTH